MVKHNYLWHRSSNEQVLPAPSAGVLREEFGHARHTVMAEGAMAPAGAHVLHTRAAARLRRLAQPPLNARNAGLLGAGHRL